MKRVHQLQLVCRAPLFTKDIKNIVKTLTFYLVEEKILVLDQNVQVHANQGKQGNFTQ